MAFVPFTEADQPTMAAFNEKFRGAISEAVGSGLQLEVGSYIGTGTYGSGAKNTISLSYKPLLVFVCPSVNTDPIGTLVLANGVAIGGAGVRVRDPIEVYVTVEWADGSVSWYSDYQADYQLNRTGVTYNYYIFYDKGGDT